VLGRRFACAPTGLPIEQRTGTLFCAALEHPAAPAVDGLSWFIDAVLPLIEAELGWETRLTVAGQVGPGVDLSRFADHARVTLAGEVAEPRELYATHRVAVVPDLVAAGASRRVQEAASFGVPAVASGVVAREAATWLGGHDLLCVPEGDAAAMAAAAVRLHRDETLWKTLRENALARLAAECAPEAFDAQAVRLAADASVCLVPVV
jgi:O-antigen biosynthesis protein